jgi:hypothetical protein
VTRYAAIVIGSTVAPIAACRVKPAFNFMQAHEIPSMLKFTIRTIAVAGRRFHFHLVGVAVVAERAFVTGGAEPVIGGGIETVVFDE